MLQVKDIMAQDVYVFHSDDDLNLVQVLTKSRHTRYIPVIDNKGKFVSLITHRDILSFAVSHLDKGKNNGHKELNDHIFIRKIIQNRIMPAEPEMSLPSALSIFLKNATGCLPVVSKNKLVGILTEADFLKLTYNYLRILEN